MSHLDRLDRVAAPAAHRPAAARPRVILRTLPANSRTNHTRTVVRECCKGDDESLWEREKFDPPPPKNPLTDGHYSRDARTDFDAVSALLRGNWQDFN